MHFSSAFNPAFLIRTRGSSAIRSSESVKSIVDAPFRPKLSFLVLDGLQLFWIEDMLQSCAPIVENSVEIRRNKQFLNQLSSRYCIDHIIARNGSSFALGKGVFMNPPSVGASGLLVNETCGRLPNYDLALPTNLQASNA